MRLLEWQRPPRALLILAARHAWPHHTHKRCDERMGWAIAAIYDAAAEGREIAYREIARRAGVHRDTIAVWVHRWVDEGWLVRLAPSGQALMPGARLPRRHKHDGWYSTTRYAVRWTRPLLTLLEPQRVELLLQAYRLAATRRRSPACPNVEQLRRWMRWPGGHDLIRQASARERAYQAAARRARERAERQRRAHSGRPAAPTPRAHQLEHAGAVIDRLQFTPRNSDRGAGVTQYRLSPREQSSRRELSPIARAREEPATTRRYRLQRATALVGDSAAAHRLLAEIERKAGEVGDPTPGSVQSQLLTMAEVQLHGQRTLSWWVGRYEQVCDWVIESMHIAAARGAPAPWIRPGAVAMAAMYRSPASSPTPASRTTASDGRDGVDDAGEQLRQRALAALAAIDRRTSIVLEQGLNGSWAPRRRPGDDPPDPGADIAPTSLGYVPPWYHRRRPEDPASQRTRLRR